MTISRFEGALQPTQHTRVLLAIWILPDQCLSWRYRGRSQAVNQVQNVGEQASRDCGLGELERDIATVASNLGANLDQLLSTVRDRPRAKGLCRLRVRLGLYRQPRHRSALLREAEEKDAKADVPAGMSAVGGRAVAPATWSQLPLIAMTGTVRRQPEPDR